MSSAMGPSGKNGYWCGPTALSLISGKPYLSCEEAIAKMRGRAFRASTRTVEILDLFVEWGIKFRPVDNSIGRSGMLIDKMCLRKFVERYRGLYFVRVGGHFVVTLDGEVFDNSRREGVQLSSRGYLGLGRKMVSHAVEIV